MGEHANYTQKGLRQLLESNSGPSGCEATELTTMPPSCTVLIIWSEKKPAQQKDKQVVHIRVCVVNYNEWDDLKATLDYVLLYVCYVVPDFCPLTKDICTTEQCSKRINWCKRSRMQEIRFLMLIISWGRNIFSTTPTSPSPAHGWKRTTNMAVQMVLYNYERKNKAKPERFFISYNWLSS